MQGPETHVHKACQLDDLAEVFPEFVDEFPPISVV